MNPTFPHRTRTTSVDLSSAGLEALAFTTPDSHGECDACHNDPRGLFTDTSAPGEFQYCRACVLHIARKRFHAEWREGGAA
jgi:hypothetical protein